MMRCRCRKYPVAEQKRPTLSTYPGNTVSLMVQIEAWNGRHLDQGVESETPRHIITTRGPRGLGRGLGGGDFRGLGLGGLHQAFVDSADIDAARESEECLSANGPCFWKFCVN